MTPKFIFVLVLALALRLFLSIFVYSGDVNNHVAWGDSILNFGSLGAYDRFYPTVMQPTYPPASLASFVTSFGLYKFVYFSADWLNKSFAIFPSQFIWMLEDQDVLPAFHKVVSMVSDLGIGVLVYALARRVFKANKNSSMLAMLMYLFNPVVIYNSSLWGQLESAPIFWVMLAFWLMLKSGGVKAHLCMAMALLFKQSSIIFFLPFMLYSLYRSGWKKTFIGGISQFILFYLFYLPFFTHVDLLWPVTVYLHRIEVGSGSNYISDHAFNLWALYTHLKKIPDNLVILWDLTANQLGKIVFLGLYAVYSIRLFRKKQLSYFLEFCGIASFVSFLFLTRMHERYLAPVLPFMAAAAASRKQLWPIYLLVSAGHLINMYHEWWYPNIPVLVDLLTNWWSILVVIVIFVIGWISWSGEYWNENKHR